CAWKGNPPSAAAATVVKSIDRIDRMAFSSSLVSSCTKRDIHSIVPQSGTMEAVLGQATSSLPAYSTYANCRLPQSYNHVSDRIELSRSTTWPLRLITPL